jgi:hypothetical protein
VSTYWCLDDHSFCVIQVFSLHSMPLLQWWWWMTQWRIQYNQYSVKLFSSISREG